MAQTSGQVSGLSVKPIEAKEDHADELDEIGQKLFDAMRQYQRGNAKAAASHAVDAVNLLAKKYQLTCGADS